MDIIIILSVCFSLYLLVKGVEYRESIKKFQKEVSSLKEANRNLAKIIEEEQEKKEAFEAGCG